MQSPVGECGGEEEEETEEEERSIPEEDKANGAPAHERGSRDQSGALSPQLHPDPGGSDQYPHPVQENVNQMPLIHHFSNLHTSEDMDDPDPAPGEEEEEEEEEEMIILHSDHPLVRRQQAALNSQLTKQLERINLELREKQAQEKTESTLIEGMNVELHRLQQQIALSQVKLEDHGHTRAEAAAKRRQVQDQLEAAKSRYSSVTSQQSRANADVSRLQADLDDLTQNLAFTQGAGDDLRSNVKAMKNARHKAGAEKNQAEERKLKQDLYVERLTKDVERLTQQIAMYEVQTRAQAEVTQTAKGALSEAEMEMESLVMAHKRLLQQWSSSLLEMGRRDEAFNAMQEAVRADDQQLMLLDREIEGYKQSASKEKEHLETLTVQLNWSQMDCATSKKLISQKQVQGKALEAQYSACLRTQTETERTLVRLSKETSSQQAVVRDQRKQLEEESATRLELEDKIMSYMQQKLTCNRAAKESQRLASKKSTLRRKKISDLWQLENEVAAVGLENSRVNQHVDSLGLTQEALEQEVEKGNQLLTSNEAKISSGVTAIQQKQDAITKYLKKIGEITSSTGRDDLSPMQIKIHALMAQIEEVAANIRNGKQLWMKRQGTLVQLSQDIQSNSRGMMRLQTEHTGMQQRKIRLESQIEAVQREETELERSVKMLRGDLVKLNALLSNNEQLSLALEETTLMEKDFLLRLKEAEKESIETQMKFEKSEEDKERLLNTLVEAEQQILLWEKKTQLVKETRSTVDVGQGDIDLMKAEIHRMEVRLKKIVKQQEQLLRESEATVARRESIVLGHEVLVHSSNKHTTEGNLSRNIEGLQRRIQDTHKQVVEHEQGLRELQERQVCLSDRLDRQKQQLIDLCATSSTLDHDHVHLQDAKGRNLAHLVTLQSRAKRLQSVCEGSYHASLTSASVGAALQSQMERVHAVSSILHRVCEELPHHQAGLRRPSQALAACKQ